jgi:CDP-4-dehydro-6-deoxyglucose reductase, E3
MDLVWVAGGSVGHYEDNLCRAWDDALDNFHYRPERVGSASDAEAWTAVIAGAIARLDDPRGRDYYVAGPEHFIGAAGTVLSRLGVAAGQCRYQAIPPQS